MEKESCMICHDPVISEKIGPCGHAVHATCIREWLIRNQSSCPLCRCKVQSLISNGNETFVHFLEISYTEELFQSFQTSLSRRVLFENKYYYCICLILWYATVILGHFDYSHDGKDRWLQYQLQFGSFLVFPNIVHGFLKQIDLGNLRSEMGFILRHKIYFNVLVFSLVGFIVFLEVVMRNFFSIPYLLMFFVFWFKERLRS